MLTGKSGETGVAVQLFVAGVFLGGRVNARIQDSEGLEYVQQKGQAVKNLDATINHAGVIFFNILHPNSHKG